MRILVVDDYLDLADGLAEYLRDLDHESRTAYDGAAAIREALDGTFDLALVDLCLGEGMDGYEAARGIKAANPLIKLVALTGNASVHARAHSHTEFDRHLLKPVDGQALIRVLEDMKPAGGSSMILVSSRDPLLSIPGLPATSAAATSHGSRPH